MAFGARAGDGTGAIGKVVDRKRDPDGNPKGTPHSNPLLDTREYVVRFLDDHEETHTANVLAENLFATCNEDGHREVLLECIADYRRLPNAMLEADAWVTKPNGTKKRRKSTTGWELLFEWKDRCIEKN